MRTVYGCGPEPCNLMLVGERPGWEETRENLPFVGPAGRELWGAFEDAHVPDRESWYATNLIKTFSKEPPTSEEIARWESLLRDELNTVKPSLVVAVGAHAARWFLGPDIEMDRCHGLVFWQKRWVVIPIFHPAAALRMPELYQGRFRADVAAVARWLRGESKLHVVSRPDLLVEDLRHHRRRFSLMNMPGAVGLDLEGTIEQPECLTFSDGRTHLLTGTTREDDALNRLLLNQHCHMHYAVRDLRALWRLGLQPQSFDDSMLAAYLLNEPQGLKTLAYRLLSVEMDDYLSLIQPLDTARVRATLEEHYAAHEQDPDIWKHAKARANRRSHLRAALGRRHPLRPDQPRAGRGHEPTAASSGSDHRDNAAGVGVPPETWPARAVSSLRRLLASDRQRTLRERWEDSTFNGLVALPKVPSWQDLPSEVGVPYAGTDAWAHRKIGRQLNRRLKQDGLWDCYQMDLSVLPMLARIESVGMQVDGEALRRIGAQLHLEYVRVCGRLEAILGYPLNPKAAEDVSETLFDELSVTPTKLTKSGKHYTTGDKFLEARRGEHEVVPLIIEGRELWKLKSSYADKLPNMLDAQGRYHPEFSYTRTASGRLAETIILLIPKHSAWGKKIRCAFVAGVDHSLVSVDLSQIELRVLAHESRDPDLVRIFREGRDPHTETAHRLLGAPARKEDQDESKHRLPAKKCYHPDTEVLTKTGWRRIGDVTRDTEVIQAYPNAKGEVRLTWTTPLDVISQPNPHTHLVHLKNEGIDIRVTPDHRMVVWTTANDWAITTPDKLKHAGRYWANAGTLRESRLPKHSEWLLRLAVALQADGSITKWKSLKFGFSRPRKIKRFAWLLQKARIPFTKAHHRNGKHGMVTAFAIRQQHADHLLNQLDPDKTFPWKWLGHSLKMRQAILDEVRYWDSHLVGSRLCLYSSIIKKNADVLQALAAVTGRKTRVTVSPTQQAHHHEQWHVSLKQQATSRTGYLTVAEEPYQGPIVCLSVPSQFLLVRDQGITLISSNCNFGAFMGLSPMGLTEQVRAGGNPEWARGCPACDYTDANPRERPEHDKTCASVVFFREYFKLYKGVRQYIDDRHAEARRFGFVRDMWGRKIYVPGIHSSSQGVVRRFERMAQATPIQSGADGISKHWNARLWREVLVPHQQKRKGWYLEPWGRTHDDTVVEVDSRFAEITKARMLKLVPQVLCIPVGAEGKIGSNWGSLK